MSDPTAAAGPVGLPPPFPLPVDLRVIDGPARVGSEQRWRVRLADGRHALLARLLPELAADPSIRRRYVRDLARLQTLGGPALAPILATGPAPDPADLAAAPPWRLREDPPGETLAAWLARRAPAPPDEVAALGAALADVLGDIHDRGLVLRDLAPRFIVRQDDGRLWLTDIGLARVDILSTRTAASLVLESSPYASPEQLTRTTLDARSDLFVLGAILYHALTGALPFGDGPALLRSGDPPPPPSTLHPAVPRELDAIVMACLAADPTRRPATAADVAAALRGEAAAAPGLARVTCQACGAALRPGQRLCLACGKEAVLFVHTAGEGGGAGLYLTKATEDAAFTANLRDALAGLSAGPVPVLNLVIGDARMYSKAELARRYRLPLRLFSDLSPATGEALKERLAARGIRTKVVASDTGVARRRARVALAVLSAIFAAVLIPVVAFAGAAPSLIVGGIFIAVLAIVALATRKSARALPPAPLLQLRPAPAAVAASDPLVARLAAALGPATAADVREQVGELALLVQRLVDHRAALQGERAELDRIAEPIAPLVDLVVEQVAVLQRLDAELAGLDEGAMVRALAASEARREPPSAREPLLAGLDRLRGLEDQRALALQRLLSAGSLLRRAVDLGLGVRDPAAEHERQVKLALHALGAGDPA